MFKGNGLKTAVVCDGVARWTREHEYFFRFEGIYIGLRGARRGHHGFLTAQGYSYIGKGIFNA